MPHNHHITPYKTSVQTAENGVTRVVFHATAVVTFDAGEIVLNSGGWWTRSTKKRMNQAGRQYGLGYRVFQKEGEWTIAFHGTEHAFLTEQVRLDRKTGAVTPIG